jgi:hypothetical protein
MEDSGDHAPYLEAARWAIEATASSVPAELYEGDNSVSHPVDITKNRQRRAVVPEPETLTVLAWTPAPSRWLIRCNLVDPASTAFED